MKKPFATAVLSVLAGFAAGLAWPYLGKPQPDSPPPKSSPAPLESEPSLPSPRPKLVASNPPQTAVDRILAECIALADTDIAAAFHKISEITPETYRKALRVRLATRLLAKDFAHVGEISRLIRDPMEFQGVIAVTTRDAMAKNPALTLETINTQLTGDSRNEALRFVVQAQIERMDIAAAVAALNSMPISGTRDTALSDVASHIGETGIESSLQWFAELHSESDRRLAWPHIVSYFSERPGTENLQRLAEVATDREERERLVAGVALRMRKTNPQAARDYVNALSGPESDYAASSLAVAELVHDSSLSFHDKLNRAAAFEAARTRSSAMDQLISSETNRDPEQTMKIVMALPDDSKRAAVPAFACAWVSIDADSAMAWVEKLPAGDIRDSAISGLVRHLGLRSRTRAREVAAWTSDPSKREALEKSLHRAGRAATR